MTILSPSQFAKLHGVSTRRIQALCQKGRIQGALRVGDRWVIPDNAPFVTGPTGRPLKPEQPD